MAPFVVLREDAGDSEGHPSQQVTRMTWVIVTVVVVSLAFLSVLAIIAFKWCKLRRLQKAGKNSPYMTKEQKSWRRNMTDLDRIEEDELQRQLMIRKSLASRTSSRADTLLPQDSSGEQPDTPDEEEEESRGDLKTDWKEFEAKLHRERTLSFESHPAVEPPSKPPTHPAVPAPARAESPPSRHLCRSPSPITRSTPSPALPRIPSEETLVIGMQVHPCARTSPANTPAANPWRPSENRKVRYDRLRGPGK